MKFFWVKLCLKRVAFLGILFNWFSYPNLLQDKLVFWHLRGTKLHLLPKWKYFCSENSIPLIKYYPSIGYNTEVIHCYVASGIKKVGNLQLDHDEIMSVVKIDLKKVLKMILSGKIVDSKTICAVLAHTIKKQRL